MIAALKSLFAPPDQADSENALRMAGALLLLEVAAADFEFGKMERGMLQQRLGKKFDIAGGELDRLVDDAMREHDLTVSLHEQVDLLNAHYDAAQKRGLIQDLWAMAYADGEIHHYEEAAIRRLADLLYVPHRDFIQTKHEVTGLS
ncbi:MAG: TerB family tellurite resistance protein [Halieaceae bacterium]|jgi:uncharacterized tellurite resistance protein B-like protein|nr:TerB family tellurite resistance protein [Halieaceae bacterium]